VSFNRSAYKLVLTVAVGVVASANDVIWLAWTRNSPLSLAEMSDVSILLRWEGPGHRFSDFRTWPLPRTAPKGFYEYVAPWKPKIYPGKLFGPAPILQHVIGLDTATLPCDGQIETLCNTFFSTRCATSPAGAPPSTSSAPSSHITFSPALSASRQGSLSRLGPPPPPPPPLVLSALGELLRRLSVLPRLRLFEDRYHS